MPTYDDIMVFGDSFSDTGSRILYTNGTTAAGYLARDLNVPLTTMQTATPGRQGVNFAETGALVGVDDAFGNHSLLTQEREFANLVSTGSVSFNPDTTVFFLDGGLNDGPSDPQQVIRDYQSIINGLYSLGARHFEIANLPCEIPAWTAVADRLNPLLAAMVAGFNNPNINLAHAGSYYDFVYTHPALYGITDTTTAPAITGRNPAGSFFYFPDHPSDAVNHIVGDALFREIAARGPAPVPTPPVIAGTSAGQTVVSGNAISPFNSVTVSDTNVDPQDSATLTVTGGGTLSGAGLVAAGNGVYTIAATSPAALTAILQKIIFTAPPLGGQSSVTSAIKLDVVDRTQTASDSKTTVKEIADPKLPRPPGGNGNFSVADQTTGQQAFVGGDKYSGPVPGIDQQLILVTPDNLNISASTPNVFIHSGSGTDAIDVSRVNGSNILDGSTGSNFLVGGTGRDTFFLDDRNAASDVYSTVVNFHSGDNVTIFGVDPVNFRVAIQDNLGAVGAKGLTYTFTAPGKPNASVVIAGFSTADLTNGRLTASYGSNADLPGQPGSGGVYLNIHGN